MATTKDKTTTPLFAARANALRKLLPIYLNEQGYESLRRQGFSRADVEHAVNHLVAHGDAELEDKRSFLVVRKTELSVATP